VALSTAWVDDADSCLKNAQALMTKGDIRGASIELRNAARLAPNNADIHIELAKIYLMLANMPSAEAEARTALQCTAMRRRSRRCSPKCCCAPANTTRCCATCSRARARRRKKRWSASIAATLISACIRSRRPSR
jgi:hypothetical protein